jgi:hypothetical protein
MGGTMRPLLFTVVLATLAPAIAESAETGDWIYGVSDNRATFYAFTTNDSGSVFGEWCSASTGKCLWMVGMTASCNEESSAYPILANADGGAGPVSIICGGKLENTDFYRYQFSSWKDLEALLKDATQIGFAIPLKAGQFRVVRFSLNGLTAAVSRMEHQAASIQRNGPPKPSTEDTVL